MLKMINTKKLSFSCTKQLSAVDKVRLFERLAPEIERDYRPKVEKSWQYLLAHTGRDTYPPDGYIQVSGRTSKRPPENLVWLMAWTVDALLEGGKLFG